MAVKDTESAEETPFHPTLTKQLLRPEKTITNEALTAASELLRLFVLEAAQRAEIEAECEQEANADDEQQQQQGTSSKPLVRADHISKIAAELILDFS